MVIAEYDNTKDRINPTETGIDSKMQAARRIGAFYGDAGAAIASTGARLGSSVAEAGKVYVDYVDHSEIRRGAAAKMTMFDNLSKAWEDTASHADVNDPGVAAKFKAEVLDPTIDKFKEGFSTEKSRDWAENATNAMQEHFMVKTSSDMMTLAKKAVTEDLAIQNNRATNAAYRTHNFSDTDYLLSSAASNIKATVESSQIKGVDAATAKTTLTLAHQRNIVKASMLGAIENSPNPEATAKAYIAHYPDLIDGAEAGHAAKAAATQARMNNVADKQGQLLQKQINQANADEAGVKLYSSMIKPDGTFTPAGPEQIKALGEYLKQPGLTAAHGEAMFKFVQGEQKAEVDNQDALKGLTDKMVAGELKPLDLVQASINKDITHQTFALLESQRKLLEEHPMNDPMLKAAMKGADAVLSIPTNQAAFALDFYPKYIKAQAKGELPANALDMKDPNSMISQSMAGNVPSTAQIYQHNLMKGAYFGLDVSKVKKDLGIKGDLPPIDNGLPIQRPWAGDKDVPDVLRPMIRAGQNAQWNDTRTKIKIGEHVYNGKTGKRED